LRKAAIDLSDQTVLDTDEIDDEIIAWWTRVNALLLAA
jgi:hypothetical protein